MLTISSLLTICISCLFMFLAVREAIVRKKKFEKFIASLGAATLMIFVISDLVYPESWPTWLWLLNIPLSVVTYILLRFWNFVTEQKHL